jgi:hypothetical protein
MLDKLIFRTEEVIFSESDNTLRIKKPSNNSLFPVFFVGSFSLFLIINSFSLFLDGNNSIQNFIFLIIGIWFFRSFLWNLRGYEIIEIDENYLHIKRKEVF